MNMPRIVLGLHLAVAAILLAIAVLAGLDGNVIQFAILASMAGMVGMLGRSVGRIAARR
jgi:hypothetical protein